MQPAEQVIKKLPEKYLPDELIQKMRADAQQIFQVMSSTPIIVYNLEFLNNQYKENQIQAKAEQDQQIVLLWFKQLIEDGFGGKNNDPCSDNICFHIFRYVLKIVAIPKYQHQQLILDFIKKYPVFILQKHRHTPLYKEQEQTTEVVFQVSPLKVLIKNKLGFFANQSAALPQDLLEFITTDCAEIFKEISALIMDRRLIIPEAVLRHIHSFYCILNAEQDLFNLLVSAYKSELYLQDQYSREQLYIREQYRTEQTVYYNRKRHLLIDKYLHKNFGISGFVTDIFIGTLIGSQAPVDNFEMLIKLFCVKIIYENNKLEAKIHLINSIFKQNNRYYPEGIFKEENGLLFLYVRQQWIHIDELIEQRLQQLTITPFPIEGFPDTVEGFREKAHQWALNKLSWPLNLAKYLFDEPPGLNDDHFIAGLEQDDNDLSVQRSPGAT